MQLIGSFELWVNGELHSGGVLVGSECEAVQTSPIVIQYIPPTAHCSTSVEVVAPTCLLPPGTINKNIETLILQVERYISIYVVNGVEQKVQLCLINL